MSEIALYYPWLDFRDANWLKWALLGWDRVGIIRPRDLRYAGDDPTQLACLDAGVLLEIQPMMDDLEETEGIFTEVLVSGSEILAPYKLQEIYGELKGVDPRLHAYRSQEERFTSRNGENGLFWIRCKEWGEGKFPYTLRAAWAAARLIVQEYPGSAWIGMHPELGRVYMAVLADVISKNNSLSPITDDPVFHDAVGALDRIASVIGRETSNTFEDTRSAYVRLALQAAVKPTNLAEIPVERILLFRARHQGELLAFREHIDGLAGEFSEISLVENPAVARAHLEALYGRTTSRHLKEVRAALKSFGIDSILGVLELKIDVGTVSGTVLGAAVAAGGHPALGVAAVGLSVVPYIAGRVKASRENLTASPVAYLLAVEKHLSH